MPKAGEKIQQRQKYNILGMGVVSNPFRSKSRCYCTLRVLGEISNQLASKLGRVQTLRILETRPTGMGTVRSVDSTEMQVYPNATQNGQQQSTYSQHHTQTTAPCPVCITWPRSVCTAPGSMVVSLFLSLVLLYFKGHLSYFSLNISQKLEKVAFLKFWMK